MANDTPPLFEWLSDIPCMCVPHLLYTGCLLKNEQPGTRCSILVNIYLSLCVYHIIQPACEFRTGVHDQYRIEDLLSFKFIFIFWPCHTACGISVSQPGLRPTPASLESGSLTAVPPRKPRTYCFWLVFGSVPGALSPLALPVLPHPFPFPAQWPLASVTGGQEEGRKLILIGPPHVPGSEFNTFMGRRLFNPSNLPPRVGSRIMDEETEVLQSQVTA